LAAQWRQRYQIKIIAGLVFTLPAIIFLFS